MVKVMIDAGHGGRDPGAIGVLDSKEVREKDLNLKIAGLVKSVLKTQVEVLMPRDSDLYLEVENRVRFANSWGPALLVSIHCNSAPPQSTANGYEVWAWKGSFEGNALALAIQSHLRGLGLQDRGLRFSDADPNTWQRDLAILHKTKCPAALVECGFMSDPNDLALLCKPTTQAAIADRIGQGIIAYLKRGSPKWPLE